MGAQHHELTSATFDGRLDVRAAGYSAPPQRTQPHPDCRVLGGFNRSSQHVDDGGGKWRPGRAAKSDVGDARQVVLAGAPAGALAGLAA